MTVIAGTGLCVTPVSRESGLSLDKILFFVFVLYLVTNVFDGVLRYALVSLDLPVWLLYLRDAAAFAVVSVVTAARLRRNGLIYLFIALATTVHVAVAWSTMHSAAQILFGFKVLLPVALGAFVARPLERSKPSVRAWLTLLWAIAAIGVLVNAVVDLPWTGMVYSVGDVDVEVSRDWSSEGIGRVAGFSRSSISAAAQISVLSIYLMTVSRVTSIGGRIARLFILCIAFFTIFRTDSRGSLAALVIVTLVCWCGSKRTLTLMKTAIFSALLLLVLLPIYLPGLHLGSSLSGMQSLQSLLQRIEQGWPDAWDLIFRHGFGLLGRGIGGIGSPQRIFAPEFYNPADNLTIFLFAYFGIFAALYLAWPLLWVARLPARVPPMLLFSCASLLYFLLFGIVMNIFEDGFAAAFLGLSLGMLARAPAVLSSETSSIGVFPTSGA
jgi:hypothetical protein